MTVKGCCAVCDQPATALCSGCFRVSYCGGEHQKADWAQHKASCSRPFKIEVRPEAGRVMVATRDLEPGDVILKEKAAVVGPSLDSSKPLCLGCSASLDSSHTLCIQCHAPLCSQACQTHPLHAAECKLFKQNPDGLYTHQQHGSQIKKKRIPKNANYKAVLVIRALLLKRTDVKKYKGVLALQSHLEEREEMGKTRIVTENILPAVQQFRLQEAHQEMVQTLCGIFDTNCFELFPSGAGDTISGIFPTASMMMHSCIKNTRLSFSDDNVLTILARAKVKAGEPLYHSYARTFCTTNLRRIGLFSGKHFGCECLRCRDPSELGSLCSALLCSHCSAVVLPRDPLDLSVDARWNCRGCSQTIPALQVAEEERKIMLEHKNIPRDNVVEHENFLEKYSRRLHPNHAFLIETKKSLSVAYGSFPGYELTTLTDHRLEMKIEYCSQLLALLNLLEPGIATQKGLCLYELYNGRAELLRRKATSCHVDKKMADENAALLSQAIGILEYEPENSVHGQLCLKLKKLRNSLL